MAAITRPGPCCRELLPAVRGGARSAGRAARRPALPAVLCLVATAALYSAGPAWALDDYVRQWEIADREIIRLDGEIAALEEDILEMNARLGDHLTMQEREDIRRQAARLEAWIDLKDGRADFLASEIARLEKLSIESYKVDPDTESSLGKSLAELEEAYGQGRSFAAAIDRQTKEIIVTVPPDSTLTAGELEAAISHSARVRLEGMESLELAASPRAAPQRSPPVVALVPGTADSEPSTEGVFFKVPIVADNVTGAEFGSGYSIRVSIEPSEEQQAVSVRIPKGLPLDYDSGLGLFLRMNPHLKHQYNPNVSYGHYWYALYYTADVTGAGEVDNKRPGRPYQPTSYHLYTIHASEKCHTVNAAMVPANVTRVLYEYLVLTGRSLTPQPPLVSPPMPDGCGDVVLLRPPFDPPLRQVRGEGILAGTVACNEGMVRHVRDGGDPLCLRPGTLERLLDLGVLAAPPEPPEPPPPPPRGQRELPHRP